MGSHSGVVINMVTWRVVPRRNGYKTETVWANEETFKNIYKSIGTLINSWNIKLLFYNYF